MARRAGDDFERGRKVGKYELVTRLSIGGMAELYLAFLPGPGGFKKFVALKMILPDVRRDESFIKMFLDEARLTAALSHPHIAQVYELGHEQDTGELYLAMEYIAGQPLAAVQRRARQQGVALPVGFTCRVVRDACLALHSAHTFVDAAGTARSIVHRDVSPSNIMVSWTGTVKVIDFGIARARGRLVRTQVGQVKGTVGYMSPEQALDEPLDARSDVFTAGLVLYELLSGAPPFPSLDGTKLLETMATKDVPPLDVPGLPPGLADVVMSALARDVTRRCPSARELARRIEASCPQLFDEEKLSAVMRQLFPDAIELSRQLLESAGAAEVNGPVIEQTVAALRRSTGHALPVMQDEPSPKSAPPPEVAAPADDAPAKGANVALMLAGLVIVGLLGGAWLFLTHEGDEAPDADPAMTAREAEVMPQLHMALAAQDVTRARQLIESCTVHYTPCPKAQALLPQVEALESKRAEAKVQAREQAEAERAAAQANPVAPPSCDIDEAKALIRTVDLDAATARLRACTTPTGLDPRAEKLLAELGKSAMTRESLVLARQAVDAGDLKAAKGHLSVIPEKGVWREPKAWLEKRMRDIAVDRGAVGPKGKVLVVKDNGPSTPVAPAPASKSAPSTPEQRFTRTADEKLAAGDVGGAVGALRSCTQALPTSAECEYRLAQALARAGDPGGSYRAYKRFLELARPSDARVAKVRRLVQNYEGSGY